MRRSVCVGLVFLAACEAEPDGLNPVTTPGTGAPADPTADPTPDPPPPVFGPAVVVDDLHVASLFEDANAFSLLGLLIDPLLAEQIAAGTLLLGLELRGVDDPMLQDDEAMSVGMYLLVDEDGDPADNFDPDAPETYTVPAEALADDGPALEFVDGALSGGSLSASGLGALDVLTAAFPLPVSGLSLEGEVAVVDGAFHALEEGRLSGAIAASLLALTPNISGDTCPGASLLDVFATGCGFFGVQPDADLDGDGLERFFDDDGDGAIDRCVDGDGTEVLGTECPQAMADGYTLILVVHGVRAELASPDE